MNDSIPEKSQGLIRQLGVFDSTMMMVGIVIGSGIFLTTGIMAQSLPSSGMILVAWVVGGLITLAGALTYAELGAAMPLAGGQYIYLREAFGPLSGFLFGWILFLVTMSGSIAALGVAFAEYFGYFFPPLSTEVTAFSVEISLFNKIFNYTLSMGQIVAVVVVILLSTLNYIGVIFGKIIQNVLTVLKIGTLLIFIIAGFAVNKETAINFSLNSSDLSLGQLIIGFGVALVAITWAFDGWNNITYAAGEIKNPKHNLPFSLIAGTLIITVLYVLTNYVYFIALPIDQITGVVRIAEKATTALHGSTSAGLLSAAVLVSVFGALNGAIFVGARVYYAMGVDKLFFKRVARVHPRFKTPALAVLIQMFWSCILTLSGTFEQLFTYVVFVTVLFYILTAFSVFILRKKKPDLPRPYKTWGYPVVPIIFIIASSGILLNTLVEKPVESLAGLGFTIVGIPVYYFWRRKNQ